VSWYWWVLVWAFVVILAIGVLALFGLSLYRKARALAREIGDAAERLGAVSEGLQELAERTSDPAVFTTASQLRQEQFLRGRGRDGKRSAGQTGQIPQPGTRSTRSTGQSVR
jgi:hypothetical protein